MSGLGHMVHGAILFRMIACNYANDGGNDGDSDGGEDGDDDVDQNQA